MKNITKEKLVEIIESAKLLKTNLCDLDLNWESKKIELAINALTNLLNEICGKEYINSLKH